MAFSNERLNDIFDKTNGRCRYCAKQLSFNNYGLDRARGAWHVDHSRSRSNGGSDHLNNLYAACVACNLDKSNLNGQSYLRGIRSEQRTETAAAVGGGILLLAGVLAVGYVLWRQRQTGTPGTNHPGQFGAPLAWPQDTSFGDWTDIESPRVRWGP
ncbi:MAG TPA: HNH endonuclease signature motif containing protein [Candidatus Thermoplasmatota archaeon]|nr:HNH endonuclease signature motif containing protein [Candidatus Thermoplasmatota archaeon]